MNKLLTIFSLLILSACGAKEHPDTRHVDPLLEEYVQSFEQYLGGSIDFSVTIGDLDEKTAGVCTKQGKSRSVVISSRWFYTNGPDINEALIFHELGHCMLNRGHNDSFIQPGNFPASVMNSYTFSPAAARYYRANRATYLKELFGR